MKRYILLTFIAGIFVCSVFAQEERIPKLRLDTLPKSPLPEYPFSDTLKSFPKKHFDFKTLPEDLQRKFANTNPRSSQKRQYNAWPDNMPVIVPKKGGSLMVIKPDSSYQYHIRKYGEKYPAK